MITATSTGQNSQVKDLMLDFSIPEVLKDDIVYCQYSLRYFIKIHQLWANKIFTEATEVLPARRILQKIEDEMREIGVEQNFLTKILRNLLTGHCDMLRTKNIKSVNMEMMNGYVARALSMHYENYFATIKATNVKSRLEPAYLAERFGPAFMENTLDEFKLQTYQSDRLPTVSYEHQQQPPIFMSQQQKSLLKPREERVPEPDFLEKRMHFRMLQQKKEEEQRRFLQRMEADKKKQATTGTVVLKLAVPTVPFGRPPAKLGVAISNSRMNLLQALNKAKSEKLAPKPAASPDEKQPEAPVKARQDKLPKSKSTSPAPSSLNDSDERSSTGSVAIAEAEPPIEEKELTKEGFLKLFGLHTIEYANYLKTHKFSKRRRNNKATEKADFHYGVNAYEFYKQQAKSKKRINKKSILYSPPITRKKRKSDDDVAVIAKRGRPQVPAPVEEEMQETPCIVCSKKGSTSTLSSCVYCYNLFHLTCHGGAFQDMRERENICPICYKKKQQNKSTVAVQQKIDAEKRQRARQHAELTDLWNKYDNLEKKLHVKNDEKKRLLHEGRRTKQKIQHLLAIVEKFSVSDEEPEPEADPLLDDPLKADEVTPVVEDETKVDGKDAASDAENEELEEAEEEIEDEEAVFDSDDAEGSDKEAEDD